MIRMVRSLNRRAFLETALAIGASTAWGRAGGASKVQWRRNDAIFIRRAWRPGDPDHHRVLLWTRRPGENELTVEVSENESFSRVVATAQAKVSAESDWTCRVLVGGLKPSRMYWYRFTDRHGFGSRVGRTITAPLAKDPKPVRFAFVSCQNANQGAQNAYRRMIFEDERAAQRDRIDFVLHLGDFIYEIVWYPEDRKQGMYDRQIRDIVRYEHGEKIADFHIPTTLADYRAIYRAYLHDPDLQDARARWPFVNMWDNHEFSWLGWQSLQIFQGKTRSAQTRKVAANQAFFEYRVARVADSFHAPAVVDAPITHFDDHGMRPGNELNRERLEGIQTNSVGGTFDLIVTDQRSYRSETPSAEARDFKPGLSEFIPKNRWRLWMQAVRITAAGLPHRSAMAIRTYLTSARTILRRLFSELNKKPGSLSNCAYNFYGDLEDLGQYDGHAGLPGRSAKPSRRFNQTVARRGLRGYRQRRSQHRIY